MAAQTDMFDSKSRVSDPETSKEAGRSITSKKLRTSQREVLQLYRLLGPMDDKAMIQAARDKGITQSESSLRSRRSELSKPNMERIAEIVAESTKVMTDAGVTPTKDDLDGFQLRAAQQLRAEGWRSPLVDTGRVTAYPGGRHGVVWDAVENIDARARR